MVAWCIVPFDAARRGPEQRAQMLEELGLKHLAYDWREEHVPTWIAEVDYAGPVGILDHRAQLDAWESLQLNLDGLDKLLGR